MPILQGKVRSLEFRILKRGFFELRDSNFQMQISAVGRNTNLVTGRINGHRSCAELDGQIPAVGGFQDSIIVPDVILIEHHISPLLVHNDRCAARSEGVKEKGVCERGDEITDWAQETAPISTSIVSPG